MSSSDQTEFQIGCPKCSTTISARVSFKNGFDPTRDEARSHLRGTETYCQHCGHELEFYYY